MRKIYLTIILGMFLISFASATVTISVNGTRPTFEATLVADDSTNQLDVDTNYYFQCFLAACPYRGSSASPASEEFNITTNSTHRWINMTNTLDMCNSYTINTYYTDKHIICRYSKDRSFLDWGGEGYLPWSFTDNETGVGHLGWNVQIGGNTVASFAKFRCSTMGNNVIVKSDDLYSGSGGRGYYIQHPEISIPLSKRKALERTYKVTKGIANIVVSGTNTWDDFLQAITDGDVEDMASTSNDAISIIGKIYGSTTHVINGDKKSVVLIGADTYGGLNLTNSQFQVQSWGRVSYYSLYGIWTDTSILMPFAVSTIGLDSVYGSNIDFCSVAPPIHYRSYNGWKFRCMSYHRIRYTRDNDYSYNSKWSGVYERVTPSYQNITFYFENDTFNNNGETSQDISTDLYYVNSYAWSSGFVNYDMKNVVSDRADKRLIIKYLRGYSPNMDNTTVNYTFHGDIKFKVIDETGQPVNASNITLKSDFNTYSVLTDESGNAVIDATFYRNYFVPTGAYTVPALTQEMGDYNLTIEKEKYSSYSTRMNISTPQDWTITIKSRDWNYSKDLKWMARNSTNTLLKLDEDGNLAVYGNLYENTNSSFINSVENAKFKIPNFLVLTKDGVLYILGELMEMIT